MRGPVNRELEQSLLQEIDETRLEQHVDTFDGLTRVSGTDDERTAAAYVIEVLESHGVDATLHEFEALVSTPERASMTVTTPTRRVVDEAITTSFGGSTPAAGVHGEILLLPDITEETVATTGLEDKLVFSRGLPVPESVGLLEDAGAAGVVFQSVNEEQLHEMIVTPVWGTPGIDDADDIPSLPVVEIDYDEGEWLRDRLAEGPVEATIETQVRTTLRTLPCPVGRIEGVESDRYMVVGNHIDSWYEGATDNGTAMAATLELARIFSGIDLRRGVVFGFWPAHSTGRYAGSTWWADEQWTDLRKNGVAYLHLDLNGLKGADSLWYQQMAELSAEHRDAMGKVTTFDIREDDDGALGGSNRPGRNSDQSFWGAGLSSLLSGARLDSETEEGGPIGGGWWWHTPEDTRDKVDIDVLVEETKLYVALVSRICSSPVLPHDFTATCDDFEAALEEIENEADGEVTFDGLYARLDELRAHLENVNDCIDARAESDEELAAGAVSLQVDLGNTLNPVLYMNRSAHEHDPALPTERLPGLRIAGDLPDSSGRNRLFAKTTLRRNTNRVADALGEAIEASERFLTEYGTGSS